MTLTRHSPPANITVEVKVLKWSEDEETFLYTTTLRSSNGCNGNKRRGLNMPYLTSTRQAIVLEGSCPRSQFSG